MKWKIRDIDKIEQVDQNSVEKSIAERGATNDKEGDREDKFILL